MEFYLDNNEKLKKKSSVVIFTILTCLFYTGIIALIANNIFPSKFYNIYGNTNKQIFYLIMLVILLPIAVTMLCKFYTNQSGTILKVSPNYQYIFSYISIFPTIVLIWVMTLSFLGNIFVNSPRFIQGIFFVMIILLPYILLNIIYRTVFIKGSFKNIEWGFLWGFIFILEGC